MFDKYTLAAMMSTILVGTLSTVPVLANTPPIFCKLSTAEMRARVGELRTEFMTQIVAVEELEDGFTYWVDKAPERLVMLANFVDFESDCCGFMNFTIGLQGGEARVSMTITGPDGTKALLEEMMRSVSFDWRADA